MIHIQNLINQLERPAPYEPGAELWNDPYISQSMLKAHLSPDTDAASYRPQKIAAICGYLKNTLALSCGDCVVDLGCGPGLYAEKLAAMGLHVTGIDCSHSSIAYAREHCPDTHTHFIEGNYLHPFGSAKFDAAIMVWEDYGVLSHESRKQLLDNLRTALKPRGRFALDVSSLTAYECRKKSSNVSWSAAQQSFWRGCPHAVLQKAFFYDEIPAVCDYYAVLDSEVSVYRLWQTFFSPEGITQELTDEGFAVKAVLSSLLGEAYREAASTIAVICEKV